jgi:hypothetical protein
MSLPRFCIKTLLTSFAFLGLLMVFTWAEESMLVLCQTMLAASGLAILSRYAPDGWRPWRRQRLQATTNRQLG